jgi:predicted transcriptional regulator
MKVEDIMTSHGLLVLRPEDELGLAVQMLLWGEVRHLPVVQDRRVVGVLTVGDVLRRQAATGAEAAGRQIVETAMSAPAIIAGPDESLPAALARMLGRRIGCLPVVADDVLIGMVTRTDLLRQQIEAALHRSTSVWPPIASIMKRAPVVAAADTTLLDAARSMANCCVRHLPVVDGDHRVIGIVSNRDLRSAVGDPLTLFADETQRARARARRVAEVMTTTPVTVREGDPLPVVTERLLGDHVGAVLVVDSDDKLVGIASYVDLLQALSPVAVRPMQGVRGAGT